MITLPQKDEILDVVKKLEFGFELEDKEIWISREFLGR